MKRLIFNLIIAAMLTSLYLMMGHYRKITKHDPVKAPEQVQIPADVVKENNIPEAAPVIRTITIPKPSTSVTNAPAVPAQTNKQVKAPVPGQIKNEYVMSFFSEADRNRFVEEAKKNGAVILDVMPMGNSVRCRVDSEEMLEKIFRSAPTPVEQSPNLFVSYPKQERSQTPLADSRQYTGFGNLALDWLGVSGDSSKWGAGVDVAVLDTGLAKTSGIDESGVVRRDFLSTAPDPGSDGYWHATAVASIIAGQDTEAGDCRGVAPAARILSYRVLDDNGSGDAFTMAKAMVDAVDSGARVINICAGSESDSYIMREAVKYAMQRGALIVASAGNDGAARLSYPAGYDGVIGVGAVDAQGVHPGFSNTGESLSVSAPGVGVTAPWVDGSRVSFSGTSAAAPFVSGTIAALLAANPGIKPHEVAGLLKEYADDAGKPGHDPEYGAGILNVDRIMNRGQKGIVNASIADVYTVPGSERDGTIRMIAYVQNRGTEALEDISLNIQVAEQNHQRTFRNIKVGDIAQYEFTVDSGRLGVDINQIETRVSVRGQKDAKPSDNSRTFRLQKIE